MPLQLVKADKAVITSVTAATGIIATPTSSKPAKGPTLSKTVLEIIGAFNLLAFTGIVLLLKLRSRGIELIRAAYLQPPKKYVFTD